MSIIVASLVKYCDTADQGDIVFHAITRGLTSSATITISFSGCLTATSSFVNVAFVQLLDQMAFDEIKNRIKIENCTQQIGEMIKKRLQFVAEQMTAA